MFRQLIVLYVGFIVTIILGGMIVSTTRFSGSGSSESSDNLQISEIDTGEFGDLQHKGMYIELEGPLVRDLFENNPFEELPD